MKELNFGVENLPFEKGENLAKIGRVSPTMRQSIAALAEPDEQWVEQAPPEPVAKMRPEGGVSSSAQRVRGQIENTDLAGQVWLGEGPRQPLRLLASGIPQVDGLLGGGIPRGDVSEIVGVRSAGRTALTCALLAASTRNNELVAVIDLPDALHPRSLEMSRAALERVLWVRPPSLKAALKSTELILGAGGFGAVLLDLDTPAARRLPGHVWPRLQRDARRAGVALMVLSAYEMTGSFAALRIALACRRGLWTRRVFTGIATEVKPLRDRRGVVPGGGLVIRDPPWGAPLAFEGFSSGEETCG